MVPKKKTKRKQPQVKTHTRVESYAFVKAPWLAWPEVAHRLGEGPECMVLAHLPFRREISDGSHDTRTLAQLSDEDLSIWQLCEAMRFGEEEGLLFWDQDRQTAVVQSELIHATYGGVS